jgi:hypothetical protein
MKDTGKPFIGGQGAISVADFALFNELVQLLSILALTN